MTDPDRDTDRRLRALLEDAVADVQPAPALDRIRSRTKVTPMRHTRPWVLVAAGAVAATAATVSVVALADGGSSTADLGPGPAATSTADTTGSATAEPTGTALPSASPSEDATPTPTESSDPSASADPKPDPDAAALPVYFVGDTPSGPRLFREFHEVAAEDESVLLETALRTALEGASLDADYATGWPGAGEPGGPTILSARFGPLVPDGGPVISIGLNTAPGVCRCDPAMANVAVQQLVYTAQAVVQERAAVLFTGRNGQPLDVLLGVDVSPHAEAAPAMEVQAPVWVITPQDGQRVGRTFTVEGRGAFFEANVSWELLRRGAVVEKGFATAQECCTLSPYSFEVTAAPGDYLLRVYGADVSGGEGAGEQEDTKRITVR